MEKQQLKDIYKHLINPKIYKFSKIRKELLKMYNYLLPSTIDNLDNLNNYLQNIKVDKAINVIIAGAGPVGLFSALYLQKYYENQFNQNVNILLVDNRVAQEGIRLPYTRTTKFGFDISLIQDFIHNLFCWDETKPKKYSRHFDYINILENLLFVVAFHYKIPMYFTKTLETYDKIKDFAKNNNFHYIFDCTGGRLGAQFKTNIKKSTEEWGKIIKLKQGEHEMKLDDDGYFRHYINNKIYQHRAMVLTLIYKNKKEYHIGNNFGMTDNKRDIKLIDKLSNKCFSREDFEYISKHFESHNIRYHLENMLSESEAIQKNTKFVKITSFNVFATRHLDKCAYKINSKLTYIALGDTTGNSEVGIYYGMDSGLRFAKHIIHLLGTFSNV